MFRFRDAYLFTWKLPSQPVELKKLPPYAVDSPEEFSEFSRVASLLDRYRRVHAMTRTLDLEFAELARERARRHPIRTYVWIPIERRSDVVHAADYLPYSDRLLLRKVTAAIRRTFEVTLGLTPLNFLCVGMALGAAWFRHASFGVLLIAAFIVVRAAFLTQLQTCKTRYAYCASPPCWR